MATFTTFFDPRKRKENDGPKSETGTESDANKSEGGEIGLKALRGYMGIYGL